MRILVSNDDGYYAPGIEALVEALAPVAEVIVVAPERNRSGASNSLTLDRPLTLKQASNGFYYVNGTPTDCVHLAVTGLLATLPDMIVSGINRGCQHGRRYPLLRYRSGGDRRFSARYSVRGGLPDQLRGRSFCNRRPGGAGTRRALPAQSRTRPSAAQRQCSRSSLRRTRIAVTRLGKRHKAEPVVRMQSPRQETVYWVGAAGAAQDAGPGTDFHAVEAGSVSVTPLQIDLTHVSQLPLVRDWMR